MIRNLIIVIFSVIGLVSSSLADDLSDAVSAGDVERVKVLLESGADANTTYINNVTPIFFAETPEVIDLLLEYGAKLEIRNAATIRTPIESYAYRYFYDEEHRDKWKNIVAIFRDVGAEYTIDTAIFMNDIKHVQNELAEDASWVNKHRGAQSVPMQVAARTGRIQICKLLLEHKADPDAFDESNGYPIMVNAVDHPAIVKLLIQHGANLKRRITWFGGRTGVWIIGDEATALHFAVRSGNLESVKLLIATGLDPSAADNEGQTPLHIAITYERIRRHSKPDLSDIKIIEFLIDNDASLRLTDKSGESPLALAKKLKSSDEVLQLIQKMCK